MNRGSPICRLAALAIALPLISRAQQTALTDTTGPDVDPKIAAAFSRLLSTEDIIPFLKPRPDGDLRERILVADSAVTLDLFPFIRAGTGWRMEGGQSDRTGAPRISAYLPDVIRPIRLAFFPGANRLSNPRAPDAILFFSPPEQGMVLAELFPLIAGDRSYESYCYSIDSMKFLFQFDERNLLKSTLHAILER